MIRREYFSIDISLYIACISQIQLFAASHNISPFKSDIQTEVCDKYEKHDNCAKFPASGITICCGKMIAEQCCIANAQSLKNAHYSHSITKYLPVSKSNFLPMRFSMKPIKNKAPILIMFFALTGRFSLMASGTAMPMMNKKAGKIKSAGVRPCQSGWQIQQGGLLTGPILSTMIIPTMVSPRQMSSDLMRTLDLGICGYSTTQLIYTDWLMVCLSVKRLSVIWLYLLTSSVIIQIFNKISLNKRQLTQTIKSLSLIEFIR